ncbi:MAG: anhydro-N-acetylmuramic acid kinase, partial [bacterium]|nr:anhydro-N-acetylmuramic acid kinase [bacterium]
MTPHSRYAIGLMSGTSADGIDAALVEIAGGPKTLQVRQKAFVTYSFPPEIHRELVQMNAEKKVSLEELSRLNFYLGELFAEAAIKVCRKGKIKLSRVSVIGSHGQTISHSPQLKKMGKIPIRSTLQIAEPSVIAERTGVTTVADFRPRDIAAGGEGAPLTPYFHYLLFRQEKRSVAVNNLGGISNLTYIPARGAVKDVIAFDTGPANMVIDETHAALYQGERCDRGGKKAREGLIDLPLVARMLSHA